jgi:type I restriction enzyme S subunit
MWKTVTLGASCKMYQPKTISAKEMVADGEYVVFGANGIIGKYNQYNHAEPQLLVTCRGATCGAVNVSQPFSWINGNAMVIQPDLNNISLKYMEYLFRGGIDLTKAITGAAQPQITRQSLEPIEFSYPSLVEQQRIVAKLDAAFAEIDEAIRFTNGKEDEVVKLRASLLSNNLTDNALIWSNVKLKDVVTYEKVNAQGSSLPYLGMENISSNTMQIVDELEIPTSTSSTFKFDETHVLYGRLRPYLKKVLVPNFEGQCSTEVFCLKPSSNLNRKFLAYWLLSPKIADKIENTSTGARMPRANMNAILEFDFFLPPPDEQEHIVAKLDAACAEIEAANIAIKKKKENFEALKSAILAQELQSEAA